MRETRQYPRYNCPGGVEIYVPSTNRRLWGHLGDISRAGLYMECPEPWAVGTEVEVRLEVNNLQLEAKGTLVTCHPGVGMGISLEMHPQSVGDFEKILQSLAAAGTDQAKSTSA
jgi:hypothetical protein